MESGTLFNPGFLGSHFNWWIGQIADDSTWRDNINPSKHATPDEVAGWGRRYKVRIIGLHDLGEAEIPSNQLPWANIMYPVTAGGGQAGATQTPNLRQGNFVFGFFLDGKDEQVPVIMGVLGNNAKTLLKMSIGSADNNPVTNTQPGLAGRSGHSQGETPKRGEAKEKVPDDRLVVKKPSGSDSTADPNTWDECAPPPAGVTLNEFGLRSDKSLTREQFADQQRAIRNADDPNRPGGPLTGSARSAFIQQIVSDGIKIRCAEKNRPNSEPSPGAAAEGIDDTTLQSAADIKRNELYSLKRPILDSNDLISSSLKSIRTILDNLTKQIDKILHAAESYVDTVSQIATSIKGLLANAACEIAKYLKFIFNKLFECLIKKVNKLMSTVIDSMFPNDRWKFVDIKELITENICCLLNKLTNQLCGQVQSYLDGEFANPQKSLEGGTKYVPICSVERMVGQIIATNMGEMNTGFESILKSVNNFLDDVIRELSNMAGLLNSLQGFSSSVGGLSASLSSALNFQNLTANIFGCDLKPNGSVADYYTLAFGGSSTPKLQIPNIASVAKTGASIAKVDTVPQPQFAVPRKDTEDLDYTNQRL